MIYKHLSAYQFMYLPPDDLPKLQQYLNDYLSSLQLKGTVLLSEEGINLYLAGKPSAIADAALFIQTILNSYSKQQLAFNQTDAIAMPYKRLFVRLKSEIITFKQPTIKPLEKTAAYLEPTQLKQFYEQEQDIILLDTRNDYEWKMGTFKDALLLNITHFSDFPNAVSQLSTMYKTKTVVTFCTGGIRCEKAALYLMEQGFKQVWQLKGGILNYFAVCGDAYFQGDCFVFDERGAIGTDLNQ